MTDARKTLGILLKESFRFFLRNNTPLVKTALTAYVPLSIFYSIFILTANPNREVPEGDLALTAQMLLLNLLALVVTVVIVFSYHIAVIKAIRLSYQGQPIKMASLYKQAWSMLRSYIWVVFLVALRVFLWALPFWVAVLMEMDVYGWVWLLLIPSFIFGIFYSFSTMSFILNGNKGSQALGHSQKIVKPAFWRFLGNASVVMLIVFPIYLLIQYAVHNVFGIANMNSPQMMPMIGVALQNCFNSVVGLYPTVFIYFLYRELNTNQ